MRDRDFTPPDRLELVDGGSRGVPTASGHSRRNEDGTLDTKCIGAYLRHMTTEMSQIASDEAYQALLADAIAELSENEPVLDELEARNRDEFAYRPGIEALFVSYKNALHSDPAAPQANPEVREL